MDSTRQVVRWGIPGALALMALCATYTLLRLVLNLPPAEKEVPLSEALAPITANLSPALGIALVLPVGFLCYQVYFWLYRPTRALGFVSADRGGEILARLTESQRAALAVAMVEPLARVAPTLKKAKAELKKGGSSASDWLVALNAPFGRLPVTTKHRGLWGRTGWLRLKPPKKGWPTAKAEARARAAYSERWHTNHSIATTLMDVAGTADGMHLIKDQWTSGVDTYHGLGAARTAIVVGTLGGVVADSTQILFGRSGQALADIGLTVGAGVVICVACALVVFILNYVRRVTYERSALRVGYGLRVALRANPHLLQCLADTGD